MKYFDEFAKSQQENIELSKRSFTKPKPKNLQIFTRSYEKSTSIIKIQGNAFTISSNGESPSLFLTQSCTKKEKNYYKEEKSTQESPSPKSLGIPYLPNYEICKIESIFEENLKINENQYKNKEKKKSPSCFSNYACNLFC